MSPVPRRVRILSVSASFWALYASLAGLFHTVPYARETASWALQARGQDLGNLAAVAVLIGSFFGLRRGSLRAFLLWTGTLFYFLYAYAIYAFFVHFNYLFLVYVAVLGGSFYALLGGWAGQRVRAIAEKCGGVGVRVPGIILVATGAVFSLMWLKEIVTALFVGGVPASLAGTGLWVNPIHVIDLSVVLPGMIGTGALILRKHPYGYVFAAPWLMFSVLMGGSIVCTLLLETARGTAGAPSGVIAMSMVVAASLFALVRFLKECGRAQ